MKSGWRVTGGYLSRHKRISGGYQEDIFQSPVGDLPMPGWVLDDANLKKFFKHPHVPLQSQENYVTSPQMY